MWYLIPGLGADERVFRRLRLGGPVQVLSWLAPQSSTEPLAHYAARLAEAILPGQPCWLVGVSFGGLLALEIGRLRPLARIVLISSLQAASELPPLLRLARATGIYRLVPFRLLARLPRLAQWFFGAKGGGECRLLCQILRDTDPTFARWATAQLLHWHSHGVPTATRLHGTHDRLLPAGGALIEYRLPGAGHFLIVSHAAQVSQILNSLAHGEITTKKY
ncbi:alpha/beta fold hydrolase [Hymenobacter sp. HMF4947]|uniref:Alpha/beta fold hydrolase n=1 Tax=Hymenobacter ginkgonis TaxID=2682976 RepID=A0A7K1TIW4_9BACT|nr:alpha/beta hydrolase [Hymenobacter ginkgonis]MVN78334.1 alpha/beta fold hydrolase [Hymenobacter ginkgonis]